MRFRAWLISWKTWAILVIALLGLVYWNSPAVEHLLPPTDEQLAVDVSPLAAAWNARDGIPWRTAAFFAQVCEASYLDTDAAVAKLREWKLTSSDVIQQDSMFVCVASNDNVVVIAFRGTDDTRDWLINLNSVRQSVAHGSIHRGFHNSMLNLRPRLMQTLRAHGVDRKKLWVTGHSLGGALAVSFTYSLLEQGDFQPWGLVTFGQPILVNGRLGRFLDTQLDGRYLRFVNERDVVTRVIPTYATCGTRVWFRGGKVHVTHPAAFAASSKDGEISKTELVESESMSEDEFERLQQELRAEAAEEELARQQGKTLYKGDSAWIVDHNMRGYLTWIVNGSTLE